MAKPKQADILTRLRRHYDQGTCNEEPQMVIDVYEEDRRHTALEIASLRKRLAALGATPPVPVTDPKVARFPSTRVARPGARAPALALVSSDDPSTD